MPAPDLAKTTKCSCISPQSSSPSLTVNKIFLGGNCCLKLYFYECLREKKDCSSNFIFVNTLYITLIQRLHQSMYCKGKHEQNYTSAV